MLNKKFKFLKNCKYNFFRSHLFPILVAFLHTVYFELTIVIYIVLTYEKRFFFNKKFNFKFTVKIAFDSILFDRPIGHQVDPIVVVLLRFAWRNRFF